MSRASAPLLCVAPRPVSPRLATGAGATPTIILSKEGGSLHQQVADTTAIVYAKRRVYCNNKIHSEKKSTFQTNCLLR